MEGDGDFRKFYYFSTFVSKAYPAWVFIDPIGRLVETTDATRHEAGSSIRGAMRLPALPVAADKRNYRNKASTGL